MPFLCLSADLLEQEDVGVCGVDQLGLDVVPHHAGDLGQEFGHLVDRVGVIIQTSKYS